MKRRDEVLVGVFLTVAAAIALTVLIALSLRPAAAQAPPEAVRPRGCQPCG